MQRRKFIALAVGAAAAWPLVARAQQGERVRRIGVLAGGLDTDDPRSQPNITAFRQALQQLGWTDGRNVKIGFVDCLSRPGGNATGFVFFHYSLSTKWLELLKQIVPA